MVQNRPADRPLNTRERRKLETRSEIIEAGVRVFQRYGYQSATIDLIAKDARVSRATFYRHFADKDALSVEIGMWLMPKMYTFIEELGVATQREQVREALRKVHELFKRAGTFFEVGFRSSVSSKTFMDADLDIRENVISYFSARLAKLSESDRERARVRIVLLYDQLLYEYYEDLGRDRPLSSDKMLDGLAEIWFDELLRQDAAAIGA